VWRLLCDQNIRTDTVAYLRSCGHDAISTRDLDLSEGDDDIILAEAVRQDRVVLTFNSDFGDIRLFPPETHCGVIRLRVHPQDRATIHPALDRALSRLTPESLRGRIAVVERGKIRLRGKR
jgi:predicted nuclease of predicted toxin-antitoxin system